MSKINKITSFSTTFFLNRSNNKIKVVKYHNTEFTLLYKYLKRLILQGIKEIFQYKHIY